MKIDERVYDKIRLVYEILLPIPLGIEGALASVTILQEQIKRMPQQGIKVVEMTPVLKEGLKEKTKHETN